MKGENKMTFNALKEKGLPLEKQVRTWHDIAHRKYNKNVLYASLLFPININ